ncbi:MAG TPA: polysaccharide biosynthesis/export family protein [Gemmataceae bacterium]|nr:polysaccharide biosynthesis/export family protein [Gemmataceae bacterium]
MKHERWQGSKVLARYLAWVICAGISGCVMGDASVSHDVPIPRELRMTTLPPYIIEPPDILIIRATNIVPKPPYRVQPLDALYIQADQTLPDLPIRGAYGIEPDGNVNLGLAYGTVRVAGMTIEEAQKAIQDHLLKTLKKTRVQVSLAQSRGMQQIQGDHIVRMDGTIGLGVYGSAYVTGMTIDQARKAIEEHLGKSLLAPEISLDVYAYNSKWYYIVVDRAGFGQTIMRLPITGRDTVLDAISQMFGTMYMSSNKHLWLARPNGKDPNDMQMFPINWPALTQGGSPATNYQLLPGDRLYVQSNPLMRANNRLNQFFAPIERVFGFTLLGAATASSVGQVGKGTGSGAGGLGGFR